MQKVNGVKHQKIWGYEIWLYSPVAGKETTFTNGQKTQSGPLVKIIHAEKPLSVQVHPDDNWAQKLEQQTNGKSESWYVLEAQPRATLVVGLKNYDPQVIKAKMANQSFEELLIKVPVKKGDFFNIPAGLVHGIGSGITVLEVQQPSDLTYRYYDYNRLENGKPRVLHLEKALQVQKDLDYQLKPHSTKPLTFVNQVGSQSYFNFPSVLTSQAIVINLENYQTFLATAGEKIDFANYVVITYK